jgi:hypothetical protein
VIQKNTTDKNLEFDNILICTGCIVIICLTQVINWKLACVPLLAPIGGHSEPRVFKFERRDANDEKSQVVMRAKLHMSKVKNEDYFPRQGWDIWKSGVRPEVRDVTFLPKKQLDLQGLTKTLEYLKSKRYIPSAEFKQVTAFLKHKKEEDTKTCVKCVSLRALQLTHRSSKAHAEVETNLHRRERDKATADFDEHLLSDRKSHNQPTSVQCWPLGNIDRPNHTAPIVDDDGTDSDCNENDLKAGELYADRIGKEVMSVGRQQYKKLKPLKIGYMIAVYSEDMSDGEEFCVGRAFDWDKNGGEKKLKVWWYGYQTNKDNAAEDRKYYRGERVKGGTDQDSWVSPKGRMRKNGEWTEVTFQESLLYWVPDTFLNVTGKINQYALKRILARLVYVKTMLGRP